MLYNTKKRTWLEGMRRLFQSYDNQSYLQLASIQSAGSGLSVIVVGQQLAEQYGAGTAICSILLGNLILWLIGISVISMVERSQANAIDNFKNYVGNYGGIFAALVLIAAFLNWFAFQINFSIAELQCLFKFDHEGTGIRIGAALGVLTALLSVGGIRLLKWLSVFSLPLLFCYHLYSVLTSNVSFSFKGTWGLSFPAVIMTVLMLLPGVINFPTFFRHARSKVHSYLAISLIYLLISFFEISMIWMRFSIRDGGGLILIAFFVILLLTICNLLNIYLASACWKVFVPQYGGGKEFAIIGLMGTLTYTFIQISTPVQFLMDLTNAYLSSLGVVLLMAYLIRIIVRHRPRPFEKMISFAAWVFGCMVATLYEARHFLQGMDALLAGVNASLLFFLVVIFLEETIWAVRKKTEKIFNNR
jgi:purine-cytosine permease-like protein